MRWWPLATGSEHTLPLWKQVHGGLRWQGCWRRYGCRLASMAITRGRSTGATCRCSWRVRDREVRPRRQVIESGDGVPLHLLAGARIEVWSPEAVTGRKRGDGTGEHAATGTPRIPAGHWCRWTLARCRGATCS